jgi:hypothetical protein
MSKKKLSVFAFLSFVFAIASFLSKISADSFLPEKFDFAEYLLRLLFVPLIGIFVLTIFIVFVSVTSRGNHALEFLISAMGSSPRQLALVAKNCDWSRAIVLFICAVFCVVTAFMYARLAYVFLRDTLLTQYRHELFAKAYLEEQQRNWPVALLRYGEYEKRAGESLDKSAHEARLNSIKRRMHASTILQQQAEELERKLGLSPRVLQLYSLAYTIDPWNDNLVRKIRGIVDQELPVRTKSLILAIQNCNERGVASRKSTGESLMTIGILYEAEVQLVGGVDAQRKLCKMLGGWSAQRISEAVEAIWLAPQIKSLLSQLSSEQLLFRKQGLWKSWTRTSQEKNNADADPDSKEWSVVSKKYEEKLLLDRLTIPKLKPKVVETQKPTEVETAEKKASSNQADGLPQK